MGIRGEGTRGKIQHTVAERWSFYPPSVVTRAQRQYVLAEYGGAGYEAVFAGKAAGSLPPSQCPPSSCPKGGETAFSTASTPKSISAKGMTMLQLISKGILFPRLKEIVKAYARDAKEKNGTVLNGGGNAGPRSTVGYSMPHILNESVRAAAYKVSYAQHYLATAKSLCPELRRRICSSRRFHGCMKKYRPGLTVLALRPRLVCGYVKQLGYLRGVSW